MFELLEGEVEWRMILSVNVWGRSLQHDKTSDH